MKPNRYTFGPVPSRRLGRSLGVDLVPHKICTYDCIYCQLGRTTNKTVERREYVPTEEVLADVQRRFDDGVNPDWVTLSGSGEPTLHSRIGDVIAGLKEMTDVPVAVLTNASLLWQDGLVQELERADLLIPSLDAGNAKLFRHINRPHESIQFERTVEGLRGLREQYRGQIWLEIMLLGGITGIDAEVREIAALIRSIRPDRVQLNTAVRPTAEDFAFAVSPQEMTRLAEVMGQGAEVVADFRGTHEAPQFKAKREDVLSLLERRPCTLQDIASALDLHPNEATKYVGELEHEGLVSPEARYGGPYYRAKKPVQETT